MAWLKNSTIVLTAATLLAFASGCNQSSTTATSPPTTASSPEKSPTPVTSSPATTASPATTQAPGFKALTGVISSTRSAVQVGNFDQAKNEFDKFEDSWSQVEDGVKAKSSETYSAIEDGMDAVKAGIKAKDKNKTLTALQDLEQNVTKVAKA